MQMILNNAEAKEYLRLKAVFNADAELISLKSQLDYFYNVYLVPVHERVVDLEHYPDTPAEATEEELKWRTKCLMGSVLDTVSKLQKELKANKNNNEE